MNFVQKNFTAIKTISFTLPPCPLDPFPTKSLWGNLNSREDIQFPEENAKRDVSEAQRLFAMLQGSPVCIYKEQSTRYTVHMCAVQFQHRVMCMFGVKHFNICIYISGEKPYKCDYCDKCFARAQNLQDHKNRHLDIKPHTTHHCMICQKSE